MSRFRRALLATLVALSVLVVGTVTADSAAAARHHHKKHHHKRHHRHHKKKPSVAKPAVRPAACPAFPANNWWHRDISQLPVSRSSSQWLSHMSTGRNLHPDFGGPTAIPVHGIRHRRSHPKVPVSFDYADESDRVPYPLGADTKIEGGARLRRRHARDRRRPVHLPALRDLGHHRERRRAGTRAPARPGRCASNALRPDGWTSADAAGLPILPGLLRYDEVASGRVDHAIRFTTDVTSSHHLWPARHDAGSTSDRGVPADGRAVPAEGVVHASPATRRRRASCSTAMKTYGLVLADNGSPWYFQGAARHALARRPARPAQDDPGQRRSRRSTPRR